MPDWTWIFWSHLSIWGWSHWLMILLLLFWTHDAEVAFSSVLCNISCTGCKHLVLQSLADEQIIFSTTWSYIWIKKKKKKKASLDDEGWWSTSACWGERLMSMETFQIPFKIRQSLEDSVLCWSNENISECFQILSL